MNKIFIDNIPPAMEKSTLERVFTGFGDIKKIEYPLDALTERPIGIAFITFFSPNAARRALEKDGRDVGGQIIRVSLVDSEK